MITNTVINADAYSRILKKGMRIPVRDANVTKQMMCKNNNLCHFKDRNCTYETNVKCFAKWEIRKTCRYWYHNFKKRVNNA